MVTMEYRYIEIETLENMGEAMPTLGRMEKLFLRAIREVLPQYKAASDEFLQTRLEKRLYPATEEIVCLLESSGAAAGLKNDLTCTTLMTRVLQVLSDYMTNEMKLTVAEVEGWDDRVLSRE